MAWLFSCARFARTSQQTLPQTNNTRRRFRRLSAAALAAAIWYGGSSSAYAVDILVTTSADSGAGSLREAITNALAGDRIIFSASLTGGDTIVLTGMLPIINTNITIDGSGNANLVIDGGGAHRAFFVRSGTLNISSITIDNVAAQGGNGAGTSGANSGVGGGGGGLGAGAAIFVDSGATVSISDVVVNNSAATGGGGGDRASFLGGGGGGGGGLGGDGGSGGGGSSRP